MTSTGPGAASIEPLDKLTAPVLELSRPMNECVRSIAGFQPEIVPSSVAKMKRLGADVPPDETTNAAGSDAASSLKTMPVGWLGPAPPGGGATVTTSGVGGIGSPLPT